jgi:hypothetical protein
VGLDRRSLKLVAVGGFLMLPFGLLAGPALRWPDAFVSGADEMKPLTMLLGLSVCAAVLGSLYLLGAGIGAVRRAILRRR